MTKDKMQSGRPLLEMLVVLCIGAVLMVFGVFSFKRVINNYKAAAMLDYINLVYASVRGSGRDDMQLTDCKNIVSNIPSFVGSCTVERVCGCGSNLELNYFDCSKDCPSGDNYAECIKGRSSNGCVTTVTAYFQKDQEDAAAALESKLGLEVREGTVSGVGGGGKFPTDRRVFKKANCLIDYPMECANGFSRCLKEGEICAPSSLSRCDPANPKLSCPW